MKGDSNMEHWKLFYKYIESIVNTDDLIKLNIIEGDAHVDFLYDNISYQELIVIRKVIAEKEL